MLRETDCSPAAVRLVRKPQVVSAMGSRSAVRRYTGLPLLQHQARLTVRR